MSTTTDRAAEVLWSAECSDGLRAIMRPDCMLLAQALADAGLLATPEHDEQVRADERARVSVVHSTLTDEQLLAELVRRGVLQAAHRDDGIDLGAFPRPRYDVRQTRYVTAWQPDTRTDEQPSDDAVTTLRRRIDDGAPS